MTVFGCRGSRRHKSCAHAPPEFHKAAASEERRDPHIAKSETPAADANAPPRRACADRPVVTREERNPDGKLLRAYQVVIDEDGDDIPHGVNTLYFETGQKKLEVHYDCGVLHGPRIAWYEDGRERSRGENIDGKNHGVWTVWYPDGTKSQEFTMDHGVWHGTYTTWHPNGQPRVKVQFVHGLQQGPLDQFDENGALMQRIDYVNAVPQPMPSGHQFAQP